MTAPTTQRDEIRQLLAASTQPLTRPEIFEQCKLVDDEKTLSTVLSQLVRSGLIKRAGERTREKGGPLALYTTRLADAGGYEASAPKSARRAKRKGPKRSKIARKAAGGGRGLTRKKSVRPAASRAPAGSRRVPKVQRNTATSPALEGFRCGIFSDGTLAINAEDGQLTLSEAETRAMFKYLDRMLIAEA